MSSNASCGWHDKSALIRAIEEACLRSVDCRPGVDQLASELGLSARTLHRRLVEAGTSYHGVINGVRSRLAVDLLERTDLPMDRIARRTGFSDVSNFRKAFRNWTGQPASHHRRGLPDASLTSTHRRLRTSITHPNLFDSHEHHPSTRCD